MHINSFEKERGRKLLSKRGDKNDFL